MVYELKKPKKKRDDEEIEGKQGQGVEEPELLGQQKTLDPGGAPSQAGAKEVKPAGGEQQASQAGMTNIGKYLDVSREQAQQLGQKVGDVLQRDIEKAQTGLSEAQDKFTQAVEEGTIQRDEDLYKRGQELLTQPGAQAETRATIGSGAIGNIQTPEGTQQVRGGGSTEYTQEQQVDRDEISQFLDSPQAEEFRRQYQAQYGGPGAIQGQEYYQSAKEASDRARRSAQGLGTSEGRQELIARALGGEDSGRFTKGALSLDQALLLGEKGTFTGLEDVAAPAQELDTKLQALEEVAADKVAEGKSVSQATREAYQEGFNLAEEEQEITQAYKDIKDEAKRIAEQEKERLGTLGTPEGIDPRTYYQGEQAEGLTKYDVATEEDMARLRALEELTGVQSKFTPYAEEAGGYQEYLDPNKYFNQEQYESAVESARKARQRSGGGGQVQSPGIVDKAKEFVGRSESAGKGAAVGAAVGGPVGSVVGGAIGGVVCFEGMTPVELYDGTKKPIKDVKLGDVLAEGGRVHSVHQHLFDGDIFIYSAYEHDVYVSGHHAVLEDGKWTRVMNSKKAKQIPRGQFPVDNLYSLNCSEHRILIGDTTFADYQEVDNDHLYSDEECLRILNEQERNDERSIQEIPEREGRIAAL